MAKPMNPLDVYSAYTYHFELHVAKTYAELERERHAASEMTTTPYQANGTLLINTRKDAHQTIDNVRYTYHNPRVDPTGTTAAVSDLNLTIYEPNGTFFIEKLQNALMTMGITDLHRSCVFALKIVFVGRKPDNTVNVDDLPPVWIPLQLINIDADFTYQGGTYGMEFSGAGAGTISGNYRRNNKLAMNDGYTHKNVAFKARTVREALQKLQEKIQKNYDEAYEQNHRDGRPLRYEIVLDERINGSLDLITKDTWAPDEPRSVTFSSDTSIIEMIKRILLSSKEVSAMISDSAQGLREEFHPSVKYPTFSMRYLLTESEAIITYHVQLYEGRGGPSEKDYEFDFLFATPAGKNVDVIKFEMKYTSLIGWMNWTLNNSVAFHTTMDNEVSTAHPSHYRDNILRPNAKAQKYVDQSPSNKYEIDAKPYDVKGAPGANVRENSGHVQLTHQGAQAARLAFNTIAEIHGATDPQMSFLIRGHYNLLTPSIPLPSGESDGYGEKDSIWLKVNIKNQQGQEFFYTGYYELFTIENIFDNGQFTQNLTCIMKNRVPGVNTNSSPPDMITQQPPISQGNRGESNMNAGIVTRGE